jgi:hypothetical protein
MRTKLKNISALLKDPELSGLATKVLIKMGAPNMPSAHLIKSFLNSSNDVISIEYTRIYLKQGLEALLHVFVPWLTQERDHIEDYPSMLQRHHLVQTCGRKATAPTYLGYSNGWCSHDNFSYSPKPGCFRTNRIRVASSYFYDADGKLQRRKKMKLILVPPPERIPGYLEAVSAAVRQLKSGNLSKNDFNKTLAAFIHSFFWAHPFDAVNKSICLAQTNMFLLRTGRPMIEHEMLDLLAYQNKKFINRKIFSKLLTELQTTRI